MNFRAALLTVALLAPAAAQADVVVQSHALEDATLGAPYQRQLVATGGTNAYVWSSVSALPPGLSLSGDGILSGSPTKGGAYQFIVEVQSGSQRADGTLTLTVIDLFPLSVTSAVMPTAIVGQPYSQQLSAAGGVAPFTWSLVGGTLPAGLELTPPDIVSGTPETADPPEGGPAFTVQVTDARGASATGDVRIPVRADLPFSIDTDSLPPCAVGQTYSQRITATGGQVPYTFTVDGLPAGIAVTASDEMGTDIFGFPTESGLFTVHVTARDYDSRVAVRDLFLVCSAGGLKIATHELPRALVNKKYAVTLVSSPDGASWSVMQGKLPAGLSLSTDGIISGTPAATGKNSVISAFVVAASKDGLQGVQALSIEVFDPSVQNASTPSKGGGCSAAGGGSIGLALLLAFPLLRGRRRWRG